METLKELLEIMLDTEERYKEACKKTSFANNEETSILNQLNNLQKKFDACVEKIQKNAPQGSDWHQSRVSR